MMTTSFEHLTITKAFKGGIIDLYDLIAQIKKRKDVHYDCCKIDVAENIQTKIFDYYRERGMSKEEIGMNWVCYGPKAKPEMSDDTVIIYDGFFCEGD